MSEIIVHFSVSQLGTLVVLTGLALLLSSLMTMSHWLIHRRFLSGLFYLCLTVLFGYYLWLTAVLLINFRAAIFTVRTWYMDWFALVCLVIAAGCMWGTSWRQVLPLVPTLIICLPVVTNVFGRWVWVTALIFAICYLFAVSFQEWYTLRHQPSVFNIKYVLDKFEHGVLFVNARGVTQLVNRTMENLMHRLGFQSLIRLDTLLERLSEIAENGSEEMSFENPWRVREQDGTVWLLYSQPIRTGKWKGMGLYATDISDYLELSHSLAKEIQGLQERQDHLAAQTTRLDKALSQRMLLNTRSQIHDTLAQKISFIHRFLEDGVNDASRLAKLREMLVNLPQELNPERVNTTPEAWLSTLKEIAEIVGLSLSVSGSLPSDPSKAKIFMQVAQEGITNVLIHSDADAVDLVLREEPTQYVLQLSNPGGTGMPVTYGQGLSGLEEVLEMVGGRLIVNSGKSFTLTARLPR